MATYMGPAVITNIEHNNSSAAVLILRSQTNV